MKNRGLGINVPHECTVCYQSRFEEIGYVNLFFSVCVPYHGVVPGRWPGGSVSILLGFMEIEALSKRSRRFCFLCRKLVL